MKLSYKQRHDLSRSDFAVPEKEKYPIEDLSHAKNALSRVSQFGSSEEKHKVRSAVSNRWGDVMKMKKDKY